MRSQWHILNVGQDNGLNQTLTNYTHQKFIDNERLSSISLELHLRKNYKLFDVVWHDIQRAAHIYQIQIPVQLLSKINVAKTSIQRELILFNKKKNIK